METERCHVCNKKLLMKDEFNYKEAYLISIAECSQCSDDGSSTNNVEEFLMCKKCFQKLGKPILKQLKKDASGDKSE